MHAAALRPYVTSGIALVGASVIAVSPIAPPLPAIHLPNPVQVAKEVELAAFVNPITTLVDVIQTAINNVSTTGGQVLADPFPVLQQLGVNGLGYANTLGTAAQGIATAITSSTLPASLQTAFGQLTAGDVAGAVTTFNNALTTAGLGLVIPLVPVLAIPTAMAQNLLNVVTATSGLPLSLGLSLLSTVEGTVFQVGSSVQAVVDAVRAGDGVTALSALLNGPAEIAGAFLNGVPSQGFVGILSPEDGLANLMAVGVPQQIAQALAPAATTMLAKVAAVTTPTALPSLAPKMVSLPTSADSTTATDGTAATAASSDGSVKTKGDDTKGAKHAKGSGRGHDGKNGGGHQGKNGGGHQGKNGGGHHK